MTVLKILLLLLLITPFASEYGNYAYVLKKVFLIVDAKSRKGLNSNSNQKKKSKSKKKNPKGTKNKKPSSSPSKSKQFYLDFSPPNVVKSVIIEQANAAIKNGLKQSEKSGNKAKIDVAKMVSDIGEYRNKINQLDQQIKDLQKHHQDLLKQPKTFQFEKELEQVKKNIMELQSKKDTMENMIGSLAATVGSLAISQGADEKTASDVVKSLVTQGFPGAPKAELILNTLFPFGKYVHQWLMQDNYEGDFESDMSFYSASGTWKFGIKPNGTCYIRLDTFNKNGYVFTEYRELILNSIVPGRPIEVIMSKILAGEFELGRYFMDMKGRNMLVNLVG